MELFFYFQTPIIALIGNDACWTQISREQVPMLGSNVACELAVSINLLLVHSSYQYTSVLIHLDGVFTQSGTKTGTWSGLGPGPMASGRVFP